MKIFDYIYSFFSPFRSFSAEITENDLRMAIQVELRTIVINPTLERGLASQVLRRKFGTDLTENSGYTFVYLHLKDKSILYETNEDEYLRKEFIYVCHLYRDVDRIVNKFYYLVGTEMVFKKVLEEDREIK